LLAEDSQAPLTVSLSRSEPELPLLLLLLLLPVSGLGCGYCIDAVSRLISSPHPTTMDAA